MATDTPMQLGMVGLGRMGAGIVRRLLQDGHHCVGYDIHPDAVEALVADEPRRVAMGAAARRLAEERYAWSDIARRLEAIYERVAGTEAEAQAA